MRKPIALAVVWTLFIITTICPVKAAPLVWVTDDTPGGKYIIGGGPSFEPIKPGIEIELYQILARELGLKIEFKRLPWNQCLYLLKKNRVDGIFPASYKKERMEIGAYPMRNDRIDPSRKTRNNAYFLYKLKQESISWDGKSFSNVSGPIGVPAGWAIVDDLEKMNLNILEVTINRKIPNLLLHGRVQGFICLETVFDAYLYPETFSNIEKIDPPIWEKPYYLMLSHGFVSKNPDLAQQIWDKIQEIKVSDRFRQILNNYLDE